MLGPVQLLRLALQAGLQVPYRFVLRRILMSINVTAKKNGPYLVTGDLTQLVVTDADGNRYDLTGKQAVALCRCGASVNKPFCDGTHSKIGFQAAEAAVRAEQGQTTKT